MKNDIVAVVVACILGLGARGKDQSWTPHPHTHTRTRTHTLNTLHQNKAFLDYICFTICGLLSAVVASILL